MVRFDWDEQKNARNRAKHGIEFETAQLVFVDPFCITFIEREWEGEERWQAIGAVEDILPLVVVDTYREEEGHEVIRIIPARRATRHERKLYAEAIG